MFHAVTHGVIRYRCKIGFEKENPDISTMRPKEGA